MPAGADVVIVTAWFPPESAPFGQMMFELARYLGAAGLSVDVITNVPNHPSGHVYAGFSNRVFSESALGPGVRVVRLGIVPRFRGGRAPPGRLYRLVSFLWFTIAAGVAVLLRHKPRVIFAVLQPLTVAVPLLAAARLRRAKVIFNVQDLHPDALVDIGLVKNRSVIAALRFLERLAYRCADALAVICDGFRDHCIARGADPAHVEVIPNWINLDEIRPQLQASRLRAEIGIPNEAFVALYAGTIGLVSGADVLIDACARLPPDSAIRVVFVGEGQLVPLLKEKASRLAPDTFCFLPFQPRDRLNDVQSLADVSVVTLLPGHGRTSVPSKVLGYMAAGRPVIAAVDLDSETARLIHAAGAGWVVPPGDPNSLARALLDAQRDEDKRHRCGRSGRRYLEDHHRQDAVLERYARLLREPAVE